MMQLLRKMLWRSLKKLKIELAYDPAIPLLGIYPKELKARTQTDICPPFFFFYGCTGSLLLRGLSLVAASRGYSSLRCAGSRHAGFSICGTWAQQLWLAALEHRLSSCGTQAQLLLSMWDLPGAGIKPVSPALAGRFLTTEPPGKSCTPSSSSIIHNSQKVEATQVSIYNVVYTFNRILLSLKKKENSDTCYKMDEP